MKRVFDAKIGDSVIYIRGYEILEAKIVKEPIDDKERPLFKIGRTDLDNGDYLVNGGRIFDSKEEASEFLIKRLNTEIEDADANVKLYDDIARIKRGILRRLLEDK